MVQERDDQRWIDALQADGPQRDAALSDLRDLLLRRMISVSKSRSDVESIFEDVVQESLLRILRSLDQYRGRSRFVTWATAIAVRVCFTELRKRKWRDVSLEALAAEARFEPVADAAAPSERRALVDAMHRVIATELTEKQRAVLLAEIKGLPQVEIARRMGSNVNAVYKLGHDARLRLKKGLEQAGFTADDLARAYGR